MTGRLLVLTITDELAGQRTDKAVAALAAEQDSTLSRVRVQSLMSAGHLMMDGKAILDASRKVARGVVYELRVPAVEKAKLEAQALGLDVVYEDNDVVVIDKPAGLVVHPAPGNRDHTLVNALLAHCGKSLSGIGGVARPGIVHRLDKDTSGLLVVAKNDTAHQKLAAQFADRSLSRTYQTIVWGEMAAPAGNVEAPIGRSSRDRKKMAVTTKGRPSRTHYKVLENFGDACLVECKLDTGRTHQIRVHMAHIKHPVVGDSTYGGGRRGRKGEEALRQFPRQALHAVGLQFIHPRTGKTKSFNSPLPKDMLSLLKILRD